MASPQVKLPSYRRQRKPNGRDIAFVVIDKQRLYLPGTWNSDESREAYRRIIAEYLVSGSIPDDRPTRRGGSREDRTVAELAARYLRWADTYYVDANGAPTGSAATVELVLRPVLSLYKSLAVNQFSPRCLKAVQADMVQRGWSRKQINRATTRVRSVFKWGVSESMVEPAVLGALQAVAGLRRGKTNARETAPIRPVCKEHIAAVKKLVSSQVAAMIDLQLLTAMRPGEVCIMRTIDLNMSSKVWTYKPTDHKNAHRDMERTIFIGPRGQKILRPFLAGKPLDQHLFSPAEAEQARRAELSARRQTPLHRGNRPGTNRRRRPERTHGNVYGVDEYRRAIARACKVANIPTWSPHRLRHNAATTIRRDHGIDVARAVCGHRSIAVTDTYAEIDHERAAAVIGRVG